MADHVFAPGDGRCSVCGVQAGNAHRIACKAPSKPKALKTRPGQPRRHRGVVPAPLEPAGQDDSKSAKRFIFAALAACLTEVFN
jgi:hypothetical protein